MPPKRARNTGHCKCGLVCGLLWSPSEFRTSLDGKRFTRRVGIVQARFLLLLCLPADTHFWRTVGLAYHKKWKLGCAVRVAYTLSQQRMSYGLS